MKSCHILITGSKGQVGQELQVLSNDFSSFQFTFVDIDELDITDREKVTAFFEEKKFDFCVNCAAYTAVDKAEEQPELAERVNVVGVTNLVESCQSHSVNFIQLSTDYVYHNRQNTPFVESDPTSPKGVYAKTKLAGDNIALSKGGMVVRTSWVYSSFGHNFVKTMLRLGSERKELSVIFDQIGTPTYAADLAKSILEIIEKTMSKEIDPKVFNQIYHYSNEGVTSWFDFAQAIFEIKGYDVKLKPIETKDYPTAAKRPHFSVLNKAKIKTTFGLEINHWRQSLVNCLAKL